jgi:hypothetical protein
MQATFPGTTADSLVGCAYLLWIAITLCGLLRWRKDLPGLVSILAPSWPLFAPFPIAYNYDLAFRAKRSEETFSPWTQLPTTYTRALHHGIWNPSFSEHLLLFRLCQALIEIPETDRKVERLREGAYGFLLTLAALRLRAQPETIQFRIRRCCPLIPEMEDVFLVSPQQEPAVPT